MLNLTSFSLDSTQLLRLVGDALLELDTWRQHARAPEEIRAFRRTVQALGQAEQMLRESTAAAELSSDLRQQNLPLPL